MTEAISIKRIYEPPGPSDGTRVLVDRLWPRGMRKEDARFDLWLKDIAPSNDLRHWFNHEPERWDEFKRRYWAELATNPALAELRAEVARGHTTLLYGAHDEQHNQAVALAEFLVQNP